MILETRCCPPRCGSVLAEAVGTGKRQHEKLVPVHSIPLSLRFVAGQLQGRLPCKDQPVLLHSTQLHSFHPQLWLWAWKGSASRPGGDGLCCHLAPSSSPAQGRTCNSSTFPTALVSFLQSAFSALQAALNRVFAQFLTLLIPAGVFCSHFLSKPPGPQSDGRAKAAQLHR